MDDSFGGFARALHYGRSSSFRTRTGARMRDYATHPLKTVGSTLRRWSLISMIVSSDCYSHEAHFAQVLKIVLRGAEGMGHPEVSENRRRE